jgi:hypothetical protein
MSTSRYLSIRACLNGRCLITLLFAGFLSGLATPPPTSVTQTPAGKGPTEMTAADLAGEYLHGLGHHDRYRLVLSEDGAFRWIFESLSSVVEFSVDGAYVLDGGYVILSPNSIPEQCRRGHSPTWHEIPLSFVVVRWGPRLYLVPEAEMIDFCNGFNRGCSQPGGFILPDPSYIRKGDSGVPLTHELVEPWPLVPPEWLEYLLTIPIKGKVLKVEQETDILVSIGKKDRLRAGMRLYVGLEPGHWGQQYDVVAVAQETARARYAGSDRLPRRKPSVGDAVSTDDCPPPKLKATSVPTTQKSKATSSPTTQRAVSEPANNVDRP